MLITDKGKIWKLKLHIRIKWWFFLSLKGKNWWYNFSTYLTRKKREKDSHLFVSRSILSGRCVRITTRCIRSIRGALSLLVIRVAEFSMLVYEVVTGEFATADLAGIVLHIQIQQSDLSSVSTRRGILPRSVINTVPAASTIVVIVSRLIGNPRWQ